MEDSDFFPVVKHFEVFAIEDGVNRRQFRELCLIREALDRLLRAQRSVQFNSGLLHELIFPNQ
jgi:hypothetical protein